MEIDKIKRILEDFYNGEATPEEEQILLQYFRSNNVAEELLDEKETFLSAYDSEVPEVPALLEGKLNTLIDNLALEDANKATVVQLNNKSKNRVRKLILAGSIAASLIIMISVGVHFNNISKAPVTAKTSAEQAQIEEAQQALLLLSANFNKGVDQLSLVSANFEKTNEILNKTLNRKNNKEL